MNRKKRRAMAKQQKKKGNKDLAEKIMMFDKLPETPIFNAAGEVTNSPASLLLGDNQEQANTYPSTYDVLGRDFFISARMQF